MNSKKYFAYVQLSRPVNVLITFFSIPAACWIAGGTGVSWLLMIFAGLTGGLVATGANAINDVFDIDIDRINRPDRPLPRGAVTQQDARKMWFLVSAAAIGLNLLFNVTALFIVVLSVALLYLYSARLKRTVLIGNIVVGLMTGMAFIYGGAVAGRIERAIIPAIFAFLVNLAREVLKDVEDMEGDQRENAVTLPLKYGVRTAHVLATASLLILIGGTVGVAWYGPYHPAFFFIVLLADGLMGASIGVIWLDHSSSAMRKASTLLKLSMLFGLLSIVAGSM
jgi:geranylgeranylglycerol-phosphate geranylgeranyltransferase